LSCLGIGLTEEEENSFVEEASIIVEGEIAIIRMVANMCILLILLLHLKEVGKMVKMKAAIVQDCIME